MNLRTRAIYTISWPLRILLTGGATLLLAISDFFKDVQDEVFQGSRHISYTDFQCKPFCGSPTARRFTKDHDEDMKTWPPTCPKCIAIHDRIMEATT